MSANKLAHPFVTFLAIFALRGAVSTDDSSKQATQATLAGVADYGRPISFEPNRGQADGQVDFLAHGAGYRLFLSHAEAVMALNSHVTVRMQPIGGNPSSSPETLGPQSSKSNYFIGNTPEKWHTNIPNYSKVRYPNVYPGIDLIYYGNQRQLEYDFIVNPSADPDSILLNFEGVEKATLDRSGDLVMQTDAGDLRWHKPVAYQEVNGDHKFIACAYERKAAHQLAFQLAAYDHAKPLIIDPVLVYSTYLGGSGAVFQENHAGGGDMGSGIAVDALGNAYVVGTTISTNFPTKNAFQGKLRSGCCTNAFIAKFDKTGKLVYSTYLGGSGVSGPDASFKGDSGLGIAVDTRGNAYVTGIAGSGDFPIKNAFQHQNYNTGVGTSCFPCGTAFVTKIDAAGTRLVFSTFLGGHSVGISGDGGGGIAVDASDNVYVTGSTDSPDFPTKNAFQKTLEGGLGSVNAFVTKFDAAGSALVYSTFLAGNNGGSGITVDGKGNTYITGTTTSPDLPTKNAFQDKPKGPFNAFVTKFDSAGNELVYSTYLGGSGSDHANSIAIDAAGHAYITGFTDSTDFPIKNAFQKELKSGVYGDAFVTKIAASGDALVYSTYLGGSSQGPPGDGGSGIAVDAHGNAFITGFTSSTDFPTKNGLQNGFARGFSPDAFVTEIDAADCALVYSTYLGGSSADSGSGIAIDAYDNAYVVGTTTSTDFPTKSAFQNKLKSPDADGNAFVTKISPK